MEGWITLTKNNLYWLPLSPQIFRPSIRSVVITSIQYLTETPQVKQQPWIGFLHLCTEYRHTKINPCFTFLTSKSWYWTLFQYRFWSFKFVNTNYNVKAFKELFEIFWNGKMVNLQNLGPFLMPYVRHYNPQLVYFEPTFWRPITFI